MRQKDRQVGYDRARSLLRSLVERGYIGLADLISLDIQDETKGTTDKRACFEAEDPLLEDALDLIIR
ncbi:hypothetical protein IJT93_04715 [bacterium]|nr:hypothetical protein [bacterium]